MRTPHRFIPVLGHLWPHPWFGAPLAAWREMGWVRWAVLLWFIPLLPAATIGMYRDITGKPGLGSLWSTVEEAATLVTLCGLGIYVILVGRFLVAYHRRIIEHAYMQCLDCGYPLRGLGESGRCPECGSVFTSSQVRQTWKFFFRPFVR